jgi:hypothetical protein
MSLTIRKQELLSVLEQTKTLRKCGAVWRYSDGTYNASYNDGNKWIEVVYDNIKNRDIAMLRELEIINELEIVEKNTERQLELMKLLDLVREYERICAINFSACYPHYIDYAGESVNVDVTQMANKDRVDELREILCFKPCFKYL